MSIEQKTRLFLNSNDRITVCENNLVNLKLASGEIYERLEPRRLFPVSKLNNYITLINSSGKEIAVIKDINDLDNESLQVIKASMEDYYFVPYISDILSITIKNGTAIWVVNTNRGIKQFEIRDRNHDIRVYKDGKIRIRDSVDNRYVIEDYRKLDAKSRRLLLPDL